MEGQKRYSCVRKTKRAFEGALALLAKEKPLNKITVKEICEQAQLSRNAFYFHYKDIFDLIEEIENKMICEVESYFDEFREMGFPKNILATIKKMVRLFAQNRDISMMLLDSSFSPNFVPRLGKLFSDFNFEYYKAYHKTDYRANYDLFYSFISNGFYGMLGDWLRSENPIDTEKLETLSYVLIKRLLVLGEPDIQYDVAEK